MMRSALQGLLLAGVMAATCAMRWRSRSGTSTSTRVAPCASKSRSSASQRVTTSGVAWRNQGQYTPRRTPVSERGGATSTETEG